MTDKKMDTRGEIGPWLRIELPGDPKPVSVSCGYCYTMWVAYYDTGEQAEAALKEHLRGCAARLLVAE